MAQKIVYCSACGNEIQVDSSRNACFCPQCGNRMIFRTEESPKTQRNEEDRTLLEKRLEEAAFYYQLSREKAEAQKYTQQPFYYLKAQDLLLDLSEKYPDDYRVWWELCKPIDFENPLAGTEAYKQYCIQEAYFNKALDLAEIIDKKRMIDARDQYVGIKKQAQTAYDKKQREAEERQRVIEQERLAEAERKQLEKVQTEKIVQQKGIEESGGLWQALFLKDYSGIDMSYFSFVTAENQTMVCIFKEISKVMYLNAFRVGQNNNFVREQAVAVLFDKQGRCLKFNGTPLRIRNYWVQPDNMLRIVKDGAGGMRFGNMELKYDKNYIEFILKTAKKPVLMGTKVMM